LGAGPPLMLAFFSAAVPSGQMATPTVQKGTYELRVAVVALTVAVATVLLLLQPVSRTFEWWRFTWRMRDIAT